MLLYKDDWDAARKRLEAWHRGEVIDRCCVGVTAPRAGVAPRPPAEPPTLEARWTDLDYALDAAEERMRCTFYGGECAPSFMPNLGPNVFAAWLGAPLTFRETTTWTAPLINDWNAFDGLRFDPDNRWWRWIQEATRRAAERGRGRYLVEITDLHGGGDGLSALRGVENFCTDLLLEPERVRVAERRLRAMWFEVCDDLYPRCFGGGQDGAGSFLGWGPGRTGALQEDILALISPRLFETFFLDAVREQTEHLDNSVFHLDGPESLPHLDTLLALPRLNGIQWQPGAAHYPMLQWIPLLRRIRDAGKCVLFSARPDEIETIIRELSPEGLLIGTSCASEREARDLLAAVARWSAG